jgi:hypothetical protein
MRIMLKKLRNAYSVADDVADHFKCLASAMPIPFSHILINQAAWLYTVGTEDLDSP